ncbi:hypothetical protein [Microbacterium sorbitolivorans]|uniref:hypothetical protein n=1 Tax=Microbacterium sorbitolivorans TaxID=1867410 RepID=UPI0013B06D81|nr:hypothetical protein [Microbacterium sorbitolivorans]
MLIDDRAKVIVNGRAGSAVFAAIGFTERGPPAVARRDPPRRPVRHRFAIVAGLVGEEPVPELGVVTMGVE